MVATRSWKGWGFEKTIWVLRVEGRQKSSMVRIKHGPSLVLNRLVFDKRSGMIWLLMMLAVVAAARFFLVFTSKRLLDFGREVHDVYSTHPSSWAALPTNHCALPLSLLTVAWGLKDLTHKSFWTYRAKKIGNQELCVAGLQVHRMTVHVISSLVLSQSSTLSAKSAEVNPTLQLAGDAVRDAWLVNDVKKWWL